MQKTDHVLELTDYRREDFSVCLGCKVCASVCTVNDILHGGGVEAFFEDDGDEGVLQELTRALNTAVGIFRGHDVFLFCVGG